ncbi:proline iminopeptidase [Prochlorococcus marinus str. MIT 9515]|uniref:Proline iminopeptidase n=1 Tax=Prochlorococcus marinus (strain MIT 9515) TaxID=167542 RepID=A2BUZ4_PROM5|nr:prolyl aminopeptidase [Prochlorococcus marinus]ABM71605.1 proline iminopeptidase [Prochlorococcus marinus str. MIT 9515]
MKEKKLFPIIEPREKGFLQVSRIHSIYWERSGNQNGKKILVIHGGPGGGSQPRYRRYFNPEKFDIIQFDQRGCGASRPFSELRENTTKDLVDDIEKLRLNLNIDSWHLFGGSWGSTLALIYAIKHPSRVKSMTLRGIFLCRKFELSWFYQYGASEIFPEEFEKYISVIPKDERSDLVSSFYKYLTSPNIELRSKAAAAWTTWELSTSHLIKRDIDVGKSKTNSFSDAFARIECHYFINHIFLEEDFIMKNIKTIESIPTKIIQGRYDVVCPVRSAWDLNKKLKNSELIIIDEAGHSMSEKGITLKLLELVEKL